MAITLESLIASCSLSLAGLGFSSSSPLLPVVSLESASAFGGTLHPESFVRADEVCNWGLC